MSVSRPLDTRPQTPTPDPLAEREALEFCMRLPRSAGRSKIYVFSRHGAPNLTEHNDLGIARRPREYSSRTVRLKIRGLVPWTPDPRPRPQTLSRSTKRLKSAYVYLGAQGARKSICFHNTGRPSRPNTMSWAPPGAPANTVVEPFG